MSTYSDFIQIDQKLYEFFSEDADRADSHYWQSFIPHQAMLDVLDGLLRAIEGSRKKSLWILGAYGTGKTHAEFVLKHLLEDPWPQVQEYFDAHQIHADYQKRLEQVRKSGKGLVIYRSSSASITSNARLMMELQVAIKNALAERDDICIVTPTVADRVLSRLTAEESVFNWERAFAKHENEFPEFTAPEEVVQRLQSLQDAAEKAALTERVASVLDREGFFVLDDPDSIKRWIRELIQVNNLKWLVFIWDEFTDFFANVNSLTGLQELTHLSSETPFLLIITTHRAPEVLQTRGGASSDDWKKLLDRCSLFRYEMESVTAYHLMGKAFRLNAHEEAHWGRKADTLWEDVRLIAQRLVGEQQRSEDLKALIPLHPYTAFVLSSISSQFSSSQRTLFRFLKQDAPGSFSRFLAQFPKEGWGWYACDLLWDYFFTDLAPDAPDSFREMASYYCARFPGITDARAVQVFKATLLLIALSQEIPDNLLLAPTLGNLRAMFLGTPIAKDVELILDSLVSEQIIHAIRAEGGEKRFILPAANIDRDAVKKYAREFDAQFDKEAGLEGSVGKVIDLFLSEQLDEIGKRRQRLSIVAAEEFKRRRERTIPSARPYQIPVVAIVAKDEDGVSDARNLARRFAEEYAGVAFAVLGLEFGKQRWQDWCEYQATAKWFREARDSQNAQVYEENAVRLIGDWRQSLAAHPIHVFFEKEQPNAVSGRNAYGDVFTHLAEKRFRFRPEKYVPTATVHRSTYGQAGAEVGLGIRPDAPAPYNVAIQRLSQLGLWPNAHERPISIYEKHPGHAVTKMAREVDGVFAQSDRVVLSDAWAKLESQPYGLFPSPLGTILFGLILRDYVDDYCWHDGANTRRLDPTKLAELIIRVLKDDDREIALSRTTDEDRRFCELIREIFGLSQDRTLYPENAREELRRHVTNVVGYPLWSLNYVGQQRIESVTSLANLLGDDSQESVTAERLARLLVALEQDGSEIRKLVEQRSNFESGMRLFIQQNQPDILMVAERLNMDTPLLIRRLRDLMNEEVWLWKEEEVTRQLDVLQAELSLTEILNQIMDAKCGSLREVLETLEAQLARTRLPLDVLQETDATSLAGPFQQLADLVSDDTRLSNAGKAGLAQELATRVEAARTALARPEVALKTWVSKEYGETISHAEAAELIGSMPQYDRYSTRDSLRPTVKDGLDKLVKRSTVKELRSFWQDLTGSASPNTWSDSYGVPIHWVLEGQEWASLLTVIESPDDSTLERLKEALDDVRMKEQELGSLKNHQLAVQALRAVALGDYASAPGLFAIDAELEALHTYLRNHAGPHPQQWTRERIRQLGTELVEHSYRQSLRTQVLTIIEKAPAEELRAMLKSLIEDPRIGIKLFNERLT